MVAPFSFEWDWQREKEDVLKYAKETYKKAPNGIDEGQAPFESLVDNRPAPVPVWSHLQQLK